jgi:MinD superfamily P-loop ATPase
MKTEADINCFCEVKWLVVDCYVEMPDCNLLFSSNAASYDEVHF